MYEPPKLKKIVNKARDKIEARLKTAKTAPVIDIQFLIDDGNFIYFIWIITQNLTDASL